MEPIPKALDILKSLLYDMSDLEPVPNWRLIPWPSR